MHRGAGQGRVLDGGGGADRGKGDVLRRDIRQRRILDRGGRRDVVRSDPLGRGVSQRRILDRASGGQGAQRDVLAGD